MADFNDNVAIVTGARRGIGASEVRLLVAPGARSSRSDVLDDLGAALAREISTAGAIVSYLHLDATRTADWHERFSNYSGDHIFIAGVHGRLRLEETGEEEWYRATMTSKQLDWA
jgi:3alpha(or 20beta)-hydroxysteroid dehydrogenase